MSRQFCDLRWSIATIVLAPRGGDASAPSSEQRRDLFAWAAATGFRGIEISARWYDIHALNPADLLHLRDEIADAGLAVSGINVERADVVKSHSADRNLERIRSSLDIAEMLGAPLVNVALALDWQGVGTRALVSSAEFSHRDFDASVAAIKAIAVRARRPQIAISVELHDDGLLDTAPLCKRFIEAVGEPNCGVNPDLGNICRDPRSPGDWRAALLMLAPIANCWHVKNYRSGQPAPVDDGDIDYPAAMQIMIDAGYTGWVSIESRIGDFRGTQAAAFAYFQRLERELHEKKRPVLESISASRTAPHHGAGNACGVDAPDIESGRPRGPTSSLL